MKPIYGVFIGSFVALIAYGVYEAGKNDVAPPSNVAPAELDAGKAVGRRLTYRSWSFEYDKLRTTADNSVIDVDGVKNGYFYKQGQQYLRMTATHLTVNTLTKDFTAVGPFTIERLSSDHRSFTSNAAVWNNATQQITMSQRIEIKSPDGSTLHVENMTYNVKTGDIHLGKITGDVKL